VTTAIGIDLGGTKILAVLVRDGAVEAVAKRDTPREGPPAVLEALVAVARELGPDDLGCVGVGAPGPVVPGTGRVGPATNLPGWDRPIDVSTPVAAALGVPTELENDANAAAYGEHQLGAGAGSHDMLAVWLGTGVGGGLVLGGRLWRGRGLAGEIGHVVVHPGGRRCGCGGLGHLEAYAGRAAMEREARRRHADGRATRLVEIAGEKRMKSSVFAKALAAGDEVAAELVGEAVEAVGAAVGNAALLVDLDRVVIGGGLGERLGQPFIDRVVTAAGRRLDGSGLQIVPAQIGDEAGALGAALLAVDRYPR
jgi:glucokinase